MPQNNEKNAQKARYIKEKLQERYGETFEKYKMNDLDSVQVWSFAKLLEQEALKNGKSTKELGKNEQEELKKIYVLIQKQENRAVLLNVDKKGKIPEGELGVYDLQSQQFELTNESFLKSMQDQLNKNLDLYAKYIYSVPVLKEFKEEIQPKTLEEVKSLILDGEQEIDEKAEQLVKYEKTEYVKEKNKGKVGVGRNQSKRERGKLSREDKVQQNEKTSKKELPEDVVKACVKLHITNVKGYYYVKPVDLQDEVDNMSVNRNGGKVLIIETAGNEVGAPDRYFGVQNERMVLYGGTQDREMEEVTEKNNRPPTDGKLLEPLKKDNATYVEFSDSEGMLVREKLEDTMKNSVQDLENYKVKVEELLEQYSQKVVAIMENALVSDDKKSEMLEQNNENFNVLLEEAAKECGVDISDARSIKLQKEERNKDAQEEIEEERDEEQEEHMKRVRTNAKH